MAKLPSWQTQAISKCTWQAFFMWFITLVIGVAFIRIFPFGSDPWSNWGLVTGMPAILIVTLIVPAAYRRGIRDSRNHQVDSDVDHDI